MAAKTVSPKAGKAKSTVAGVVPVRGSSAPGKLTAVGAAAKKAPGYYADGQNLYLRVAAAGSKSWCFIYTVRGKTRERGLGSFYDVTLAQARELATQARSALAAGLDPIEQRRIELGRQVAATALEEAMRVTFTTACERYIETHRDAWSNAKHVRQWQSTLRDDAGPVLGHLVVRAITEQHVLQVLQPIWLEKTETASRLRGRIEKVLDWATVAKLREGPNPARWKANLDQLLAAPNKIMNRGHHASMPYTEVPAFVAQLRDEKDATAAALEFCILTGARTKEVCGVTWGQIDLGQKLWICPPSIMKMKKEHRVPLVPRVMDILLSQKALRKDDNEHVFPGRKPGAPMSNMAMSMLLERMGVEDATTHGFRSSFRTWAAERTNHPREICEAALAHDIAGAVEGAYLRSDHLLKRRKLMEAWAGHCSKVANITGGTLFALVPLPTKRKQSA